MGPNAVLASNTSGLSINALADVLDKNLHHRFCGVHFFNPPRYMHLVELIPCAKTPTARCSTDSRHFCTTTLGKGVVYAKDTPNFIGNRIGVFSMLATMYHTEQFKLGFDVVDALTGPAIGHPKSATYRTSDVVGLDTMGHVIKTMDDTLPDDPWHGYFKAPAVVQALIAKGALGQKAGAGFFRKVGKDILVLDPAKADYVPQTGKVSDEVGGDPEAQIAGREIRQAARERRSAGAVPLGGASRPFPLCRIFPGRHRRQRARHRLRDALGLRLATRAVRDLAGRRLGRRRQVDRRRHRRRQGDEQGAAAGLGGRPEPHRRARRARLVLRRDRRAGTCRLGRAGVQAPAVSGNRARHAGRQGHDRSSRTTTRACGISAATISRSCRSRPRCTRSAPA